MRRREAPRPQAESMMPTFPSAHEQQQQELHRQKQEEMDARRRDRGIFGHSQADTLSRLARKRKLAGGLKGGGGADVTSILEGAKVAAAFCVRVVDASRHTRSIP